MVIIADIWPELLLGAFCKHSRETFIGILRAFLKCILGHSLIIFDDIVSSMKGVAGILRGFVGILRGFMGILRGFMSILTGFMGILRVFMGILRGFMAF